MRATVAMLASLVLMAVAAAGCGGSKKSDLSPREQGMKSTYKGSYQVKGMEGDQVQGVGVFSDGSFRIVMERAAQVVIHNEQSGENWLIELTQKKYEAVSYDKALLKAGFMPHLYMKGYFDLAQYWGDSEFRMDTADGRSIRAYLEGPEYLPSLWEAESQGKAFKSASWKYRRVNHVSPDNFALPEGLTPK